MLRLVLLLCGLVALEATKQNFVAKSTADGFTDLQALEACFNLGYCTFATGCCNGNGECQAPNATSASCVCSAPQECRSQLSPVSYGTYETPSDGTPSQSCTIPPLGCCSSDSDDLSFSHMGGCHLNTNNATTMDPEVGAQGNLLVRTGDANYADGYSTSQFNIDDIDAIVSNLTSASRGVAFTSGNMMGLGFLEFAVKDIVDYEYDYDILTPPLGPNNVTYPTLKWQSNTGIVAGNTTIPKEFANNASAVIDLGPLFDWAHRIPYPTSNLTGPYLDLTDAMAHWNDTHHMPLEFIVALRYYHAYHNFVVRALEEFFCGQNSTVIAISNTCTVRANYPTNWPTDQDWQDFIFEQARRSTMRFSQALLQVSVLQLALEYYDPSVSRSGMDGHFYPSFQLWWRREETQVSFMGDYYAPDQLPPINQHQNWNGDLTRTALAHHIQAGVDFYLSMRNPNTNTSASDPLLLNCSGIDIGLVSGDLPFLIVQLSHTSLQRYGSQIQSVYSADLALQVYRTGELGLGSYNTHVNGLTNTPAAAPSDTNLYFGSQIEWDSARQYYSTMASVVMANVAEINDVTGPSVDRTGYYHYDPNTLVGDGYLFHPAPGIITVPASGMENCYLDSVSGSCTDVATNAAYFILGSPLLPDSIYTAQGMTYGNPTIPYAWPGNEDPVYGDSTARQPLLWPMLSDYMNPFFYNWDGLNTYALKQSVSDIYYLPNPIAESIPTNMAWNNIDWDADEDCYQPSSMSGATCRQDGMIWNSLECFWYWPSL